MKRILVKGNFLMDFNGNEVPSGEIGKMIANALGGSSDGANSIKLYEMAQRFWREEDIELDTEDFKLVRKEITDFAQYTALAKGQILKLLDSAEEIE